ncbi:hypothetical protein SMACR_00257 [Sordaria macrospora]|uniref:WGS project CABT00000000 data, contig 2.1 n=2 Tax=Sordaria macrospora TaxID=5147 RepID=F7VKL4_SORMK|nr:uncharacterized protein SMAC_00257 [Sordaria macrospora k-hell]KAA8636830.1 hypothetical protein SMACR_00257 [Sordaria macrospora]KAH7634193.1 hypothetical protein B0T09DRAFT_295519 [Sordaria sp. MPI-SDFR-AT-0083]WPJ59001.1 hypothetical protein SMAC4_00257 [Sordaria macrospora]CCC06041.1 unnamed protein product [Sordaria macrospora k-hell]
MPIGDLLASITGEKPSSSSTSAKDVPVASKRKADDDLRGSAPKAPRTEPSTNGSARPNGNVTKSSTARPAERPMERPTGNANPTRPAEKTTGYTGTAQPRATTKPTAPVSSKTTSTQSRVGGTSSNGNKAPLSRPLVSRPAPSTPVSDSGPPKRRSFAEIMARAQTNQHMLSSVGKIQHKKVERQLSMKERKGLKAEEAKKGKKDARPGTTGRSGVTAGPARNGTNGTTANRQRSTTPSAPVGAKPKASQKPVEEKKVKKAALATTGYQGTARPRPGATATKPGASTSAGASRGRGMSGYGASLSRPRRREEEDEELDDFIEYDEDEDDGYGYGRRGGYDSPEEDDSDMEAGISDIDAEERRAEMVARKEDMEQEALEKRLKREKEARKQAALAKLKSRAGDR